MGEEPSTLSLKPAEIPLQQTNKLKQNRESLTVGLGVDSANLWDPPKVMGKCWLVQP